MIITMVAVRMVQMPIDEVVDVVPVRNSFVSAARPVNVSGIVTAAGMPRSTGFGIGITDRQRVLFNVSTFGLVMKVAIVQIIDMIVVLDRLVATVFAMFVVVICMFVTLFSHY